MDVFFKLLFVFGSVIKFGINIKCPGNNATTREEQITMDAPINVSFMVRTAIITLG